MIAGLPYDAEVEYLESTGTQYIDTGVFHDSANKVLFKLKIPNRLGTWDGPYADYINESLRASRLINSKTLRGTILLYHATIANDGATVFKDVLLADSSITLEGYTSPSEYSLNGVVKTPAKPSVAGVATRSMRLFYSNAASPIASRFYYFRIDNQCDFIPVRFTNKSGQTEGAMYDRVTKKLFRNSGTGSFIIGPDVAKPVMGLHFYHSMPTARDYVQDGLVAMWDGIENVGWGVHNPNATVWKNLADPGNGDFTVNSMLR